MANIAITISRLTKNYRSKDTSLSVFKDFSVNFNKGSINAVVGPSGCGKSTLLRLIAGLEKPTNGEIIFHLKHAKIGMIFQEKALYSWRTVEGNVGFGLELDGVNKQDKKKIINFWLNKVGLSEFKHYYPFQLSGGMRQRLAFARCMALKPEIVLMDEPFGSLDSLSRSEILCFVEKLFISSKTTVILVTHSIKEAIHLGDFIYKLTMPPVKDSFCRSIDFERPRTKEHLRSATAREIEESFGEGSAY